MDETGSRDLKIWLADGTNYPGQDDMRGRQDRLAESLATIYERIGDEQRLVLEYKFFEPAFYHTDVPDWGTSYAQVAALGDKAFVCLDTGHHAPGTNIEFIVAQLLRLGKLGSFDFNTRFYADDDLIVGRRRPVPAVPHPVRGHPRRRLRPGQRRRVHARPVPQHREEDPRPDPLGAQRAGDDRPRAARRRATRWTKAQESGDVLAANAIFMDAFYTDVRARPRRVARGAGAARATRCGVPGSGYQEQIEADRVGGTQAGWN